ncbi:MAG: hypothetical protein IT452_01375 [Planctomycetia bacterium]|nr:hypothetical protein [Planctomycetia bacterium]
MSRPSPLSVSPVRLALVPLLAIALSPGVAEYRRGRAVVGAFEADVARAAELGARDGEHRVEHDIRAAAALRGVSLRFVDVALRDGHVCVRVDYTTEAWPGPLRTTRNHETRTSAPCLAVR